jgi:hypothetical protein
LLHSVEFRARVIRENRRRARWNAAAIAAKIAAISPTSHFFVDAIFFVRYERRTLSEFAGCLQLSRSRLTVRKVSYSVSQKQEIAAKWLKAQQEYPRLKKYIDDCYRRHIAPQKYNVPEDFSFASSRYDGYTVSQLVEAYESLRRKYLLSEYGQTWDERNADDYKYEYLQAKDDGMAERFRRTNKMIEVDNHRMKAGEWPIPWAYLKIDPSFYIEKPLLSFPKDSELSWQIEEKAEFLTEAEKSLARYREEHKYETYKDEHKDMAKDKAQDSAKPTVTEELIPIELNETNANELMERFETRLEAKAREVSGEILSKWTGKLSEELDKRVEKMRDLYRPKSVMVAIQINKGEATKFEEGAHPQLPYVIQLLGLGQYPFLVGPAGCGKTTLGAQAAKALKRPFSYLSFTAGVSETWLYGRQTPNGFVEGSFSKAYREGHVYLADEIGAADSNLMLTIKTALSHKEMYNPINGELCKRHENFAFIAADNTYGKGGNGVYSGRNRLDAATLDEFVYVSLDYLPEIEEKLTSDEKILNLIREARSHIKKHEAQEIVSYRSINKAVALKAMGQSYKKIAETLTLAWSPDIRKEFIRAYS